MHPTVDIFAAMIESSPKALAACRAIVSTPAQVAFAVISDIAAAPDQRTRDQMIGFFSEQHGLLGVRSEAEFHAVTENVIEHAQGGRMTDRLFEPKRSAAELAEMVALSRKGTPHEVSPAQVQHVAQTLVKAAATRGLAERMRTGDRRFGTDERSEMSATARDDAERRALIASRLDQPYRLPSYDEKLKANQELTLRENLALSADVHAALDIVEQHHADPLESLREASNL